MLFWLGVLVGIGTLFVLEVMAGWVLWRWFLRPEPDTPELRAFRRRLILAENGARGRVLGQLTTPILDLAERGAFAPEPDRIP